MNVSNGVEEACLNTLFLFQDVLNHSDSQAVLYLANLIKGKYMFDLIVTDNKGLIGKDSVVVTVKEGSMPFYYCF